MLTLNPDGTATVHLVARDVELRRPSILEYRTLRESVKKLGEVHDELVRKAQEENDAYRASLVERPEGFDVEEWAAREQHARDNVTAVQDSSDALRLEWFHAVYETLVGGTVDDEEVPSQVLDARWPVQLQEHWRTRPTLPGAP